MSNFNYQHCAAARYHLECPSCHKSKGQVDIEQHGNPGDWTLKLTCKTCGNLGTTDFDWDFSTPTGVTMDQHGAALGRILTVWLVDNPPPVVDQLGAIARREEDELVLVQSDRRGPIARCPNCHIHYKTDMLHKCRR